jgi:hypothetical protein
LLGSGGTHGSIQVKSTEDIPKDFDDTREKRRWRSLFLFFREREGFAQKVPFLGDFHFETGAFVSK